MLRKSLTTLFIHLYTQVFTKNHWFSSRLLVSSTLGLFLDIPLLLCVMEILQPWAHRNPPPHNTPLLQQITDGVDIGVGQHLIMVKLQGWSAHQLSPVFTPGERSCTELASSPLIVMNRRWDQFSCFHTLGVSCPKPTPSGQLAPLCYLVPV